MSKAQPKYFSHNYEFKLDKIPTKKSDRIALRIVLPGIFLGFFLAFLGGYELFIRNTGINPKGMLPEIGTVNHESFLDPTFFDITIILIGLWVVLSLITSYIKYRKIKFDGKVFEVINRPVFGSKTSFKEPLKNYEGVMLRIEFFQFGFMNKNRYILELHHKDPQKCIPLYISTKGKNIRAIWGNFSHKLKLPALIITDEGITVKDAKDIDKSLIELAKEGKIQNHFNNKEKLPASIAYTRKNDKTIIKVRKFLWDIYNIIAWFGIVVFGGILLLSYYNNEFVLERFSGQALLIAHIAAFAGLVASIFVLFKKDKIVIKKHKLIIVHKFVMFSRKNDEVNKDEIESIEISFIPATNRYFLAIVSKKKTLIFGKKLSVESLKWVKGFLVNEVIE